MIKDIKEMITKIIENPATINWYYFLKFGFDGDGPQLSSKIISLINEEMPEDSRLYQQLLDVVKKITDNEDIIYDFIVKVLCKLIVNVRGFGNIEEYLRLSNRLYDCTSGIRLIFPCVGTDLFSLDLSVRGYNCLKRYGCKTVDDVITVITENKLHEVKNLTEINRKEILEAVEKWKMINKWSDK